MIYENGVLLAECDRFGDGDRRSVADIDLNLLRQERMRMGTFDDNRRTHAARVDEFRCIAFTLDRPRSLGRRRLAISRVRSRRSMNPATKFEGRASQELVIDI
jgi:NAD+ synthase (glutamine-hydrolysing)